MIKQDSIKGKHAISFFIVNNYPYPYNLETAYRLFGWEPSIYLKEGIKETILNLKYEFKNNIIGI